MWTRSEFVNQELATASQEKFHAKHSHDTQLLKHPVGDPRRFLRNVRRQSCWRHRHVEDSTTMCVLDCAIVRERPIAAARRHDRKLTLEIDKCFEHRFNAANRL